jgi:hypothetical protein
MIVPDPSLARLAAQIAGAPASPDLATILPQDVELRVGQLAESLAEADLAIASTGTVTMECAYFGVPTVAMYKTSWSTPGYRPQFYFRTTDVTGSILLPEGTQMVMPGDNTEMSVELIAPIAMDEGLRFAIREGGRTVGAGRVTKINK